MIEHLIERKGILAINSVTVKADILLTHRHKRYNEAMKGVVARPAKTMEIYVGLRDKVAARVLESPGHDSRQISSYLEAQPNSTRAALSKLVKSGRISRVGDKYYPPRPKAQAVYTVIMPKPAMSQNTLQPDLWHAAAVNFRYWLPAGMVVGAIVGYGLACLLP